MKDCDSTKSTKSVDLSMPVPPRRSGLLDSNLAVPRMHAVICTEEVMLECNT